MTYEEAYESLDLAVGSGMNHVNTNANLLKKELEIKISTTLNKRLLNIYENRLEEVEKAYSILRNHYMNSVQLEIIDKPQYGLNSSGDLNLLDAKSQLLIVMGIIIAILIGVIVSFSMEQNKIVYEQGTVPQKDIVYAEAKIGTQIWMLENLNVSEFRDGTPIAQAATDAEWVEAGEEGVPAWCYYDNNSDNGGGYGKLYNWYAVSALNGLAPEGWHIPSDEEWTALTDHLGGESVAGKKMKSMDFGAERPGESGNGTRELGFTSFPAGYRAINGVFDWIDQNSYWWSATESSFHSSYFRGLFHNEDGVSRFGSSKKTGFSVRCVRD